MHHRVQLFSYLGVRGEREIVMDKKPGNKALRQRIQSGQILRQDVARKLAELAFGKANDCVKLVLEQETDLDKLDLSLLAEVKRNDKGRVEIKLIDRLQVLEQLAALTEPGSSGFDSFLQSLQGGEDP